MPRVREFDPEKALEDAVAVFWEKGYTATSVEDLVVATGVNRYGLYDVYGSKHGLFLEALRHYRRNTVPAAIAELEEPGAGLDAIRAVFGRVVGRVKSGRARFGCLMCNMAEEMAPFDPEVAKEISGFQRKLTRAFARAVAVAQEAGKVSARLDPAETGRYLAGLIQGANYLARSPAAPRAVEDFVRVGLRTLE